MIPAEFDYVAPGSLDDALAALNDGGEDAKVLAGGHSLIPLMKLRLAAPALLVDLRRVEELRGVTADNGVLRFGAMVRHHEVATGGYGLAVGRGGDDRRPAGPQHGDDRRHDRARRSGLRPARDPARRTRARSTIRGLRRRARGRRGGLLRGLPDDRGRRGRDPHLGQLPERSRATGTATRSSTAARRTGRWWPSPRWSRRAATARARTCASA